MRLFWRKPRMKVGRFTPPPPVAPPTVERMVEEGLLISGHAVRMAVKNAIIVAALRERADLDRDALASIAAEQYRSLAGLESEAAERADDLPVAPEKARAVVRRRTARALEDASRDREQLDELVERARAEAWAEIAGPIADRAVSELEPAPVAPVDPEERAERIATFLALDLTQLAHERDVEL